MATPKKRVVDDATIQAIRDAPAATKNTTLAKKYGITPQYVSLIRRGKVIPQAAKLSPEEVEKRILDIVGDGGTTEKISRAADLELDNILLELDDLKHMERPEIRAKRLPVLARALRDTNDVIDALRKAKVFERLTDDQVMAALAAAQAKSEH